MLSGILFPLGIGLLLLAIALFGLVMNEGYVQRLHRREAFQQTHQLPLGELVYENLDGAGEEIYSDSYPLIATPAYVIKDPAGSYVPIEVQHIDIQTSKPANHHLLQIIADCLILEDYSETPPTHGILRYPSREFTVDYTPARRKKVIRLLEEMHTCHAESAPQQQKQTASKCRACLFQPICPTGQKHIKPQS